MSPSLLQRLQALGYTRREAILLGHLFSAANTSVEVVFHGEGASPIHRTSMPGRRLVAQAKRHAEQVRMSWEYCGSPA